MLKHRGHPASPCCCVQQRMPGRLDASACALQVPQRSKRHAGRSQAHPLERGHAPGWPCPFQTMPILHYATECKCMHYAACEPTTPPAGARELAGAQVTHGAGSQQQMAAVVDAASQQRLHTHATSWSLLGRLNCECCTAPLEWPHSAGQAFGIAVVAKAVRPCHRTRRDIPLEGGKRLWRQLVWPVSRASRETVIHPAKCVLLHAGRTGCTAHTLQSGVLGLDCAA